MGEWILKNTCLIKPSFIAKNKCPIKFFFFFFLKNFLSPETRKDPEARNAEGSGKLFLSFILFSLFFQVKNLHKYDCLRANKSMLAWGVEARVPFLDREFLEYAMNLDPKVKLVGPKVIISIKINEPRSDSQIGRT